MSSTTTCVTDTSVVPFPTLGSTHIQTSNTALPHIPYRNARSSPLLSLSDLSDSNTSNSTDSADCAFQSRSATSVRYDSGSSSSSSTPSDDMVPTILTRLKRVGSTSSESRHIFTSVTPASTPVKPKADGRLYAALESKKQTPLFNPSDDEDMLRQFPLRRQAPPSCKVGKLTLEGSTGKHARHASDSGVTSSVASPPILDPPTQTIRKKSGQPVKSSLKSARRPELHVVTDSPSAKSEPVTPTHAKAVKFDSKLEYVKLFLAEQKPLAVSRDGSPTSDTSGEEFPSFIYGNGRRDNRRVQMLVPTMPSSLGRDDNVALQDLALSQDQQTITGNVWVRNIAYEKWLAARFTLDWWQTTSEVTARYEKSIEQGAIDVFTFTIRLHDIWSRIEEKTIFIALRYRVAGHEYWDNNAGKNYHIKFAVSPASEPLGVVDNEKGLRDLDSKLQDLAKTRSAPTPITTPYRVGRSFSADYRYSSFTNSSGRYDFASAYKAQRVRNTSPPTAHSAAPAVAPWSDKVRETEQAKTPPRPRPRLPPLSLSTLQETADDTPVRPETKPARFDSLSPSSPEGRQRNHHRGYVDRTMEGSPNLRRTPTGSPLKFDVTGEDATAQLPRTRSLPLPGEKLGLVGSMSRSSVPKPSLSIQIMPADDAGSEGPTPYEVSQSGSSSTSSSLPPFSPPPECSRSDASYKQFIDRFCFYTGVDPLLQEPSETLLRSHSTSSIERYMLSHSPPSGFSLHSHDLSARFSFESSGTTTPAAVAG